MSAYRLIHENGAAKTYLLRLEKGEQLMSELLNFCQTEEIGCGQISGIGGLSSVELGFYDLVRREYLFHEFHELLEICNLNGNIALVNDKPFAHLHVVLSRPDYSCLGGHLKEGTLGGTGEFFITSYPTTVGREADEQTGLKLLSL